MVILVLDRSLGNLNSGSDDLQAEAKIWSRVVDQSKILQQVTKAATNIFFAQLGSFTIWTFLIQDVLCWTEEVLNPLWQKYFILPMRLIKLNFAEVIVHSF